MKSGDIHFECKTVRLRSDVLQYLQMRKTITVRLPDDLADWLRETAEKTGVAQSLVIRQELEKAKRAKKRTFMRLAGAIEGPAGLSKRKGFSLK
jgi:predicted transcriptional regulator